MGFFSFLSSKPTQLSNLFWGNLANFVNRTNSNVSVTPENAMQFSAYWCAVRAISEDIAKLKVRAYKMNGNKKEYVETPITKTFTDGFNDETNAMVGIETLVSWMLTFGNAYAEIAENRTGEIQLFLIHPTRVKIERNEKGQLIYKISSSDKLDKKIEVELKEEEMLHLKGLGNGINGFSVGEIASESLGIALSSQKFTSSFFGNNLSIGTILETPRSLEPQQKESIRQEWKKKFTGKTGDLAILDRDFKINKLQMSSTDAELLATRKFQVEEIARWFRIPPHKIMEMSGAKYANLEQNELNYITDTLTPWITRIERQLKFKFHRDDDIIIDIDEKGLARGDMQARTAYLTSLYNISAITPNEIREFEGFQRSDNTSLDEYYQQLNMQSVQVATDAQKLQNELTKKQIDDTGKKEDNQKSHNQDEEEVIEQYQQTMKFMLSHLVQSEYHAHSLTYCEEAHKAKLINNQLLMKEHLEKFYAKHKPRLEESLKQIFSFICSLTGKSIPNCTELADKYINMPKKSGWQNVRLQEIITDILALSTEPKQEKLKLGEVALGDDNKLYMMTEDGLKEAYAIPKNS